MIKVEEPTVDVITVKEFNKKLQEQFDKMCATGKLFRVALAGSVVWELYLKSFENDPIFRDPNSSEHNCNTCNNFIRRYGNIVSIDENYNTTSIFDFTIKGEYAPVVKALSHEIKRYKVSDVFFETFNELNSLPYETCKKTNDNFQLGVAKNVKRYTKEEAEKFGVVKPDEIRDFNHIHLFLPKLFVKNIGASVESIMGEYRDAKTVFKRAMDEIPLDTLLLVKDLINQGSLLDGTTHLFKVEAMVSLKEEYDQLKGGVGDNWCWVKSYEFKLAKFKNELIGVLCSELAEGKELNEAAKAWNKRVDPVNYMKTTAPITKRQIEEAKKFVEENGYTESFNRRFATLDDIKVSEILHANVGKGEIKAISIFDSVKSTSTRHKRSEFDKVEEVSIDKFMKDILPGCTSVEAFLTNQQMDNMVSLTTANNPDSKPIFKWNNNFSWTFNGNLAGKSQIREVVVSKGGKIDGVLRFSAVWNDNKNSDHSDLDLWCKQPDGEHIGFNTGYRKDSGGCFSKCGGQLDVDDRGGSSDIHAENIYFQDISKMRDGVYKFWINQFSVRNSHGFKAEIEFGGETYNYEYAEPLCSKQNVQIAEVTLKSGTFTIKHLLPESGVSSKEIYGLETNQFHKVNLMCVSPNHWDGNNVGNKHYFFMLDGCKPNEAIRSFHNENLLPELAEHRKVLEVLGATNMINPTDKQLSGLGYNATVRDELVVKLSGTHKRVVKLTF